MLCNSSCLITLRRQPRRDLKALELLISLIGILEFFEVVIDISDMSLGKDLISAQNM
jgi:hypothetical protein